MILQYDSLYMTNHAYLLFFNEFISLRCQSVDSVVTSFRNSAVVVMVMWWTGTLLVNHEILATQAMGIYCRIVRLVSNLTHWLLGELNDNLSNFQARLSNWWRRFRWLSLDLTDDKSTLVQVMAWCRKATSHYLSLCWPRSLSPCSVTRPQRVN